MMSPWDWLSFKKLGIRITARFGGASAREKEAFNRKWNAKCSECKIPRYDHAGVTGHEFKEGK